MCDFTNSLVMMIIQLLLLNDGGKNHYTNIYKLNPLSFFLTILQFLISFNKTILVIMLSNCTF